jgi:hypothetical protein
MAEPDHQIKVARYIAGMVWELEKIAISAANYQLAFFLGMARAEADLIVRQTARQELPAQRRLRALYQRLAEERDIITEHRERRMLAAKRFDEAVLPLIRPLKAEGKSLRKIADALNAGGVPTAHGGKWAAQQVADILRRARLIPPAPRSRVPTKRGEGGEKSFDFAPDF